MAIGIRLCLDSRKFACFSCGNLHHSVHNQSSHLREHHLRPSPLRYLHFDESKGDQTLGLRVSVYVVGDERQAHTSSLRQVLKRAATLRLIHEESQHSQLLSWYQTIIRELENREHDDPLSIDMKR